MSRKEPRIQHWRSYQRVTKVIEGRAVRFKCGLQSTIQDVLRARNGWVESQGENDWDFIWTDKCGIQEIYDNTYLEENVKLNHFRNHYELTRKNLMAKNLKRLKKHLEREHGKIEAMKCDFFPATFELPSEYHMFVEEFKKNPGKLWIMKPIAKSQGKGIFLFRKLKDIIEWKKEDHYKPVDEKREDRETPEAYIVQRYIDNPYLIGGKKFDLRVYILVTSYVPLKAWLFREGFARFTNTRYSLDSIDDTYIHLTNVAIQKTAPAYDPDVDAVFVDKSSAPVLGQYRATAVDSLLSRKVVESFAAIYMLLTYQVLEGSKWSLRQLRMYLMAKHGKEAVSTLFRKMDEIFIKSLQSVQRVMINDKHCFELYGYDILIDDEIKPWLCEVNASPSLTASNAVDYDLKFAMLTDVLNVLDLEGRLTGREKRVGGFDLIWNDGPVTVDEANSADCLPNSTYTTNSFLGCSNNREKQLKLMYKNVQLSQQTQVQSQWPGQVNMK